MRLKIQQRFGSANLGSICAAALILFSTNAQIAMGSVVYLSPTSNIQTDYTGGYIATDLLAGSFDVNVVGSIIYFQNIDIHTAILPGTDVPVTEPPIDSILPQTANFDPNTGAFSGSIVCITSPCPLDSWSGNFDGTTITLEHNFFSPDATLAYAVDINATVVPIPAAVWLFGSGLLVFAGALRRKMVYN